ncbi:unnamed protein product, partial [Musa acuminata var. zebrina]
TSNPLPGSSSSTKPKKGVTFVDSDKDFVDVLLSFLTLPNGTIISLTTDQQPSLALRDGKWLNKQYPKEEASRQMLLFPRNASATECKSLKVNIDDTDEVHYACSSQGLPPLFSLSVKLLPQLQMPGVFVRGTRFVVGEDLAIAPVDDFS